MEKQDAEEEKREHVIAKLEKLNPKTLTVQEVLQLL